MERALIPFTLGAINWVSALLVVAFLFVCVLMILIVLIQRPQGGGLSGAFGASAAGSGQTAFGARTGDALTIATIAIFFLYLAVSIGLNFALRDRPGPAQPMMGPPGATTPAETTSTTTEPIRIDVQDPAPRQDEPPAAPETQNDEPAAPESN